MPGEVWAVGVDLGATKLEMARVAADGQLSRRMRVRTPDTSETVQNGIVEYVRDLMDDEGSKPAGVGVGVAGQISRDDAMIDFAPNLGWQNVPLGSNLRGRLNVPVTVMNDVRAATWGEWLHGAGRDCDDLACVFVGTGIGGGVVLGGKMLYGHSNTAGEIGHMVVDLDGPECRCGNRGCLEAFAGGWGIARRAQEAARRDPVAGEMLLQLAGGSENAVTAKTVAEAAHADDPLARQIVIEAAGALVAGMTSLVNAFNPCRLIFGGGVVEGLPELVEEVKVRMPQRGLPAATACLRILSAELPHTAAVVGAAAYCMYSCEAKHP